MCQYFKKIRAKAQTDIKTAVRTDTVSHRYQQCTKELAKRKDFFKFFISCIFYMCYNKNYQQMRLFVLCLYFLFLVFSLHVSGFLGPIIGGISNCCFYATIWFMQCFVDSLLASADWFVVVTSVYHHKPVR